MSFQRHFAHARVNGSSTALWTVFYAPFFALIIFFLFYQNQLGESIWITQGMRGTFSPSFNSNDLPGVQGWLQNSFSSIWPDPNAPAPPHNDANYYIGAIRVRQRRQRAITCARVWKDYFGDDATRELDFPGYLDVADRAFYTDRVGRDYPYLNASDACYGAYDLGLDSDTATMDVDTTGLLPEVQDAFSFSKTGQLAGFDPIGAQCSSYDSGGYGLVINVTVNGSYATTALQQLLDAGWLDDKSRVVTLEFVVLNYNNDLYARVRFGAELTAMGAIYPIDSTYIIGAHGQTGALAVAFLVILWILIAVYILTWLQHYFDAMIARVHVFGDSYPISLVSALTTNWLLVIDLIIIVTIMLATITKTTYSALMNIDTVINNGEWPAGIEHAASRRQEEVKLSGANICLVFLRFLFIISQGNKRIATVYETIHRGASDIIAILSLWIFALFSFTLSAVILFGYGTPEAFNLQTEFLDLFNTGSGGNPFYYDYTLSRREAASVFWVMYFVVCFFLLFSMVVAVLTGTFADVKEELYDHNVAGAIIRQQERAPWYNESKGIDGSVNRWIYTNIVVRELLYFIDWVRFRGNVPLIQKLRSHRIFWSYTAQLWSEVDKGTPEECLRASATLVMLGLMCSPRTASDEPVQSMQDGTNTAPVTKQLTLADRKQSHRKSSSASQSPPAPGFTAKTPPLIKLLTIADRRMPLWEEFVFYRFSNERDCIHRYLVWMPAVLLGTLERDTWLHAVEEFHYYQAERELYTVDLSESRIVTIAKLLNKNVRLRKN